MSQAKGIAIGFVAGLAVAAGAIFLTREEPAMPAFEDARIAALAAQIDRLERTVSRLNVGTTAAGSSTGDDQIEPPEEKPRQDFRDGVDQQQVIASADAMVDFAIQTGQWTRQHALDLTALTADLPVEEQGRIHARISRAINEDRLQIELP